MCIKHNSCTYTYIICINYDLRPRAIYEMKKSFTEHPWYIYCQTLSRYNFILSNTRFCWLCFVLPPSSQHNTLTHMPFIISIYDNNNNNNKVKWVSLPFHFYFRRSVLNINYYLTLTHIHTHTHSHIQTINLSTEFFYYFLSTLHDLTTTIIPKDGK